MFLRKYWIPIIVFVVAIAGSGLYLLRTRAPRETLKVYKAVQPIEKSSEVKVPMGDTSQGGHFHGASTWHADSHGQSTDNTDTAQRPPPVVDPPSVEGELTPLEKLLLERGIDISKLPRGPNGELLRGPTGGIALVKNPVAPTQGDIKRFETKRQLTERLAEITTELQNFPPDQDLSPEAGLRITNLLEEHLKISQDLGFKIQSNGVDPLVALELQRFKLKLLAENPDGYPVSAAPKLIELNRKLHRHDVAEALEKASTKAIESGKSSFTLHPEED